MVSQTERTAYLVTMIRVAVTRQAPNPVMYATLVYGMAFDKPKAWYTDFTRDPERRYEHD